MKKILLVLSSIVLATMAFSQGSTTDRAIRNNKIKVINENAAKNAQLLASFKPVATLSISDDFKATYKYFKAWILDDIIRIATDAKIGNVQARVLPARSGGVLGQLTHWYTNAPVFSDKIMLSELREQMIVGTTGRIEVFVQTTDGTTVAVDFGKDFTIQSTKAAPAASSGELEYITITTICNDFEKGFPVPVMAYFSLGKDNPKLIAQHVQSASSDIKMSNLNTWKKSDFKNGFTLSLATPQESYKFLVYLSIKFTDSN
ncbi:MAG: hypothetical protein SGI83_05625 [Bacteroidota bacterium]|nr:hypothetical protein [Bacteroidota bacterium]